MSRRLLVTSMGSAAAQNLARFVRDHAADRFFVIGADAREEHAGLGLADEDVVVPPGHAPDYVQALVSAAREYAADAVIPVMEPELAALTESDAWPEDAARLLISSADAIRTCASKRALMRRLADAGVPTPQIHDDDPTSFPLFAKRDRGTGSRGAFRIDRPEQLAVARASPDAVIVMEHLSGLEHSVDGIASDDHDLVQAVARTRDEVKHGLATRSRVVGMPQEVVRHVATIGQTLGLRAFFNIQYFYVEGRGPIFTDVNPRLGGAMILSFEAGLPAIPYLEAWLDGAELPSPAPIREGLRLLRRWQNVILD
jgi:carbamoyl-phosphate synthase large subunit